LVPTPTSSLLELLTTTYLTLAHLLDLVLGAAVLEMQGSANTRSE
jgi:hypothetical protein